MRNWNGASNLQRAREGEGEGEQQEATGTSKVPKTMAHYPRTRGYTWMGPGVTKGLANWLQGLVKSCYGYNGVFRRLFTFRAHLSRQCRVHYVGVLLPILSGLALLFAFWRSRSVGGARATSLHSCRTSM